ncbi:MAG: hypothetical protein Q4C70_10630, partial [Planctomycetia bacterium]|nr:hypothetical protein [Planctomycetia bacterium]
VDKTGNEMVDRTQDPAYLGPEEVLFTAENELCVLERDAGRIDFLTLSETPTERKVTATIQLPQKLNRMHRCGEKLYVSSGFLNGHVWEIDIPSRRVLRSWTGIHSPWGLTCSPKRNLLYVGRRFHGDILIIDLNREKETAEIPYETALRNRVSAVREPVALAILPDESEVYIANLLPLSRSNGATVSCCFSILNLDTETVTHRQLPDGCGSMRDICVSPDGRYVFMVHTHGNHRTITSQLYGGWTNRNGFTIYDREREGTCTYLIDNFQEGLTNPWNIRVSPDGKLLAIAVGGNREVGFVGIQELVTRMERDMNTTSPQYVFFFGVGTFTPTIVRVKVPELSGIHALAMNEKMTVIGGYFTDNLAIFSRIDAPERIKKAVSGESWQTATGLTELTPEIVALGKPPVMDAVRLGMKDFFDGERAQEHWHSCVTCHPDARVDGMNWDLLNDGVENPKNSKNMLYSHMTPPNMITGVREDGETATRAGFIHIHFKPMTEPEYCNVDEYLKNLEPVPGITLNADGTLTESAKRGKRLFFSPKTGCSSCHHGKYFTDMKMHDVGTQNDEDFDGMFDTPTLIETFRTAPYLHDGRYLTLEELLWEGKHGETDGNFGKLSEQDKADLIEYVLSL